MPNCPTRNDNARPTAAGGYSAGARTPYLAVDLPALHAEVVAAPQREQLPIICDDQLVVELYSR